MSVMKGRFCMTKTEYCHIEITVHGVAFPFSSVFWWCVLKRRAVQLPSWRFSGSRLVRAVRTKLNRPSLWAWLLCYPLIKYGCCCGFGGQCPLRRARAEYISYIRRPTVWWGPIDFGRNPTPLSSSNWISLCPHQPWIFLHMSHTAYIGD